MTYEEALEILEEERDWAQQLSYVNKALEVAKETIEKQIPKKPIRSKLQIRYCEVWKCPDCGFEFSGRVVNFCYRCGQAIDWSDTE